MVCVEFRREGEKIAKMREGDKRKGGRIRQEIGSNYVRRHECEGLLSKISSQNGKHILVYIIPLTMLLLAAPVKETLIHCK